MSTAVTVTTAVRSTAEHEDSSELAVGRTETASARDWRADRGSPSCSEKSGDGRSGDLRSGDWRSGDERSGDWRSGDGRSGDWRSGDRRSGDERFGDLRSGDWRSRDGRSGDLRSGDWRSGDGRSGDRRSGDWRPGDGRSGDRRSGDWRSGDRRSGDRRSGDKRSGDRRSGNWRPGDKKSERSGDWRLGNKKSERSGDWRLGNKKSERSSDERSGDKSERTVDKKSERPGNWRSGDWRSGNGRSGDKKSDRSGDWGSGDQKSERSGDWGSGDQKSERSGDWRLGDGISGDKKSERSGDKKSERSGDKKSVRSGDGRSGDAESERSGDGKSERSGDKKSERSGDGRSGDKKSERSGDGRSGDGRSGDWRSGYKKSERSGDGRSGDKKSERSRDGRSGDGRSGYKKSERSGDGRSGDGRSGYKKSERSGDGRSGDGRSGDKKFERSGAGRSGDGRSGDKKSERSGDGRSGDKKSERSGDGRSGDGRSGDLTEARETKLFIRVLQHLDSESLCAFLTLRAGLSDLGIPIQPTENDTTYYNGSTYYSLTCPSRSKANKVCRNLTKPHIRDCKPRVDCRFSEFPSMTLWKRRFVFEDRKTVQIADTLSRMEAKSNSLVAENTWKGDAIQRDIDRLKPGLRNLYTESTTWQEIEVLEQKLLELQKQTEEFKATRDELKTQLSSLQDDADFFQKLKTMNDRFDRECGRLRRALPVYAMRREIVDCVRENQVTVILGETGSGKSTQLPQFLYESELGPGIVVCTQPRRVAAVSLAVQVSREMGRQLGQLVGFKRGCREELSQNTRILYATDHSPLDSCLTDPHLSRFSCIIVDEAHERSLHTDLLISLIKRCLPHRPDLRVIVTSATIDPKIFQDFFGGCPVLRVPGRVFPVEVRWESRMEEELTENYCEEVVKTIVQIHVDNAKKEGDILAFVTSPADTEKCCQLLQQKKNEVKGDYQYFPLHGKQQQEDQQKVFGPSNPKKRKIVIATNCAETSITIEGILHVVDTGLAKQMQYDPKRNMNSLRLSLISRSSADQRKGRAGRTAPGVCYRLYSPQTYHDMDTASTPEILRTHFGHALLKLAQLGLDPDSCEFVQSPSAEALKIAWDTLHSLGAVDRGELTETGRWIARLPFDPRLGLMTYLGRETGLLYETIVMAAVMSAEGDIFYRGSNEHKRYDVKKVQFSHADGDCLTGFNVYRTWLQIQDKNGWCLEHSLNAKVLRGIRETVDEVCHILREDLPSRTFSAQDESQQLRRMIARCFSANLCHYLGRESAGYFAVHASRRVRIHPSSSLSTLASVPEWVVFNHLVHTSDVFITGVTPVEESWLQDMDLNLLGFRLEDIQQQVIQKIKSYKVGPRIFFAIVGPRYTRLRQLEEDFFSPGPSILFMEAVRENGEIIVYSTADTQQSEAAVTALQTMIDARVQELKEEDSEERVAGHVKYGVRAVIGQGGQVEDILMPHQSRRVYVKAPRDSTEDEVREKLEPYGDIKLVRQFSEGRQWGFVIFKAADQAAHAVRATDMNMTSKIKVEAEHRRPTEDPMTSSLCLRWWRNPDQVFVFVTEDIYRRCLALEQLDINGQSVAIHADSGESLAIHPDSRRKLKLSGITSGMTTDLIQRSLLRALDEDEEDVDLKTSLLVTCSDHAFLDSIRREIQKYLQPQLQASCSVHVTRPACGDDLYRAIITFTNVEEADAAYERFRKRLEITVRGEMVDVYLEVNAHVIVSNKMWGLHETDVRDAIADLEDENIRVDVKPHDGRVELFVTADGVGKAVRGKSYLQDAVEGERVDYKTHLSLLMEDSGMLLELEQEAGANVKLDRRLRKITVHGPQKARTEILRRMEELAQQVQDSEVHVLRGEDRPPGLMKALIVRYGEELDGLVYAIPGLMARLDFRHHRLTVLGSKDNLNRAAEEIRQLTERVWDECKQNRRVECSDRETCSACLCPIERGQLHRLEACAHPYCKDCLQHQIHYAIAERVIPVVCCHEHCERPLVVQDLINGLSRDRQFDMAALVRSAVRAFIESGDGNGRYRNCPTADCPAVYRLPTQPRWLSSYTSSPRADIFQCPECCNRTCTFCHRAAHPDKPCSRRDSEQTLDDNSNVEKWMSEEPSRRKSCPRCGIVIEKNHGCRSMRCTNCRTIFCWLCGQKFPSERKCYDHLVQQHGGIFPDPEHGVPQNRDRRQQNFRPNRFARNDRYYDRL